MKTYQLFEMFYDRTGIYFKTTDKATKEWVIDAIKNIVITASVTDIPEKFVYSNITKLKDRDVELGSWLVAQLCSKGWEPFSVLPSPSTELHRSPLYFFRFESSAN
ncbi:MAG TPA: hypothetical protein VEA58_01740 [Anaerovoracaceae bacterium]|nr:hypothetical protein [Anaerovoracaceae bacterium]